LEIPAAPRIFLVYKDRKSHDCDNKHEKRERRLPSELDHVPLLTKEKKRLIHKGKPEMFFSTTVPGPAGQKVMCGAVVDMAQSETPSGADTAVSAAMKQIPMCRGACMVMPFPSLLAMETVVFDSYTEVEDYKPGKSNKDDTGSGEPPDGPIRLVIAMNDIVDISDILSADRVVRMHEAMPLRVIFAAANIQLSIHPDQRIRDKVRVIPYSIPDKPGHFSLSMLRVNLTDYTEWLKRLDMLSGDYSGPELIIRSGCLAEEIVRSENLQKSESVKLFLSKCAVRPFQTLVCVALLNLDHHPEALLEKDGFFMV